MLIKIEENNRNVDSHEWLKNMRNQDKQLDFKNGKHAWDRTVTEKEYYSKQS